MADPIKIFWKRLSGSELLSQEQLTSSRESVEERLPEAERHDLKRVAKFLIRENVLTPFQAKSLLKGGKLPLAWGEYRILDEIQDGPFPEMYSCVHVPTGHRLALRLYKRSELSSDLDLLAVRRTIEQLRFSMGPHSCRVYELLEQERWIALSMDDTRGKLLSDRVAESGALKVDAATSVVYQTAQSLDPLHQAGIPHSDVQPRNIIVDEQNGVFLYRDPLYQPVPIRQATGASLASLELRAPYLAPEIGVQNAEYSAVTDVYALGCTTFELIEGQPPFQAESLAAVMKMHAEDPILSLADQGKVDPTLQQIITYMMAKRPDIRYQSTGDVANQLATFCGDTLQLAPPAPAVASQATFESWLKEKPTLSVLPAPSVAGAPAEAAILVERPAEDAVHNSPSRIVEARQRAKRRQRIGLAVFAFLLLVGGGGAGLCYWIYSQPNETETAGETPKGDGEGTGGTTVNGTETTEVKFDSSAAVPQQIVEDDGKLLWESPTQGEVLQLTSLPNSPRLILAIRPSGLLSQSQGPLLLEGLGPDFRQGVDDWQTSIGLATDQVEQLIVTLHDDPSGKGYRPAYQIRLDVPIDTSTLTESWAKAQESGELFGDRFDADGTSYWISEATDDEKVSVFLMGPSDLVDQAIDRANQPPTMQPDLKIVAASADADRHLNLLFLSSNLANPASRSWFRGSWQPLWKPLQPMLLGGIQAGCLSLHLDGDVYAELAVKGQISQSPKQVAAMLDGQLGSIQVQIENGIATLPPNPYWERVRLRYVNWIREFVSLARVGVEGRLARVNVWLPAVAAHNVVAGSELALATLAEPASEPADDVEETPPPATIAELLKRPLDFSVSSDDMINVMGDLQVSVRDEFKGMPFEFEIRLMGNDLRLEGITQNQRISNFSMTEKPLEEILTGLVVTANPDKSAESPKDEKQKLLWVAAPSPDDEGKTIILITTRAAAVKNAYPLPAVFGGDAE